VSLTGTKAEPRRVVIRRTLSATPQNRKRAEGALRLATLPEWLRETSKSASTPTIRRFWRTALGYVDEQTAEGAADLVDPDGVRPTVWFQKVPEIKTSKNRMHLDISVKAQEHVQATARATDGDPGRARPVMVKVKTGLYADQVGAKGLSDDA
jgi:hypothetical protein